MGKSLYHNVKAYIIIQKNYHNGNYIIMLKFCINQKNQNSTVYIHSIEFQASITLAKVSVTKVKSTVYHNSISNNDNTIVYNHNAIVDK